MRAADPGAGWIASERDGDWVVVRIGVAPTKVTGTATRPPPVAPQGDPHSAIERAAWFTGVGGLRLRGVFAAQQQRREATRCA